MKDIIYLETCFWAVFCQSSAYCTMYFEVLSDKTWIRRVGGNLYFKTWKPHCGITKFINYRLTLKL